MGSGEKHLENKNRGGSSGGGKHKNSERLNAGKGTKGV